MNHNPKWIKQQKQGSCQKSLKIKINWKYKLNSEQWTLPRIARPKMRTKSEIHVVDSYLTLRISKASIEEANHYLNQIRCRNLRPKMSAEKWRRVLLQMPNLKFNKIKTNHFNTIMQISITSNYMNSSLRLLWSRFWIPSMNTKTVMTKLNFCRQFRQKVRRKFWFQDQE